MRVSIIIPTYREDQLGDSIDRLASHLVTLADHAFELCIVDDSPESDKPALRALIAERDAAFAPRVRVAALDGEHRGKGHAIKLGILASRGDAVFTMDADLPVPVEHVGEFLGILAAGDADAVIAERPLARNADNPIRFVLSRGLFVVNRALIFQSREFKDTQCGFKLFRGDALRALAADQIVEGGMYDVEYLYAAKKRHWEIAKVTVVPNPETRESKINWLKCLVTDPVDLLRVKVKGLTGGYRASAELAGATPTPTPPSRSGAR